MNNLYFACLDCKVFIDAGYRWAYLKLEKPGVATRGHIVDPQAVLNTQEYWNPPKEQGSSWLYQQVFPPLREFLKGHKQHRIVFGEIDDFASVDEEYLDWLQIGYLMMVTPRYLVEVLGFETWEEVQEYMEQQEIPPAWWDINWGDPSPREIAKQRFEELAGKKDGS